MSLDTQSHVCTVVARYWRKSNFFIFNPIFRNGRFTFQNRGPCNCIWRFMTFSWFFFNFSSFRVSAIGGQMFCEAMHCGNGAYCAALKMRQCNYSCETNWESSTYLFFWMRSPISLPLRRKLICQVRVIPSFTLWSTQPPLSTLV